jgi:transposase
LFGLRFAESRLLSIVIFYRKESAMGASYAQDLRDRILAAYDRGMMTQQIAKLFQVSKAWARRVKQRRREHAETSPRAMGGARVVKIDPQRLRQLVAEQPDATTRELHQRLGCDCSESAVGMALNRLGLTFKKRRSLPANRIGPTLRRVEPSGRRVRLGRKRSV